LMGGEVGWVVLAADSGEALIARQSKLKLNSVVRIRIFFSIPASRYFLLSQFSIFNSGIIALTVAGFKSFTI